MEPLLGAFGGIDSVTRQYSERRQRDSTLEREQDMSTVVEKEEEARYDQGIGQGGAFGSRKTAEKGIERVAWEYQNEDETIARRRTLAQDKEEAQSEKREPETPVVKGRNPHEQVVDGFRFVDVSSKRPVNQPWQVYKNTKKRNKEKRRDAEGNSVN